MNRTTLSLVGIGISLWIAGCGGPQAADKAPPAGSGTAGSVTGSPAGSSDPEVAPIVTATATSTPGGGAGAVVSAEPDKAPPAHSVSSLTGAPATTGVSTVVPGAAPTPDELEKIAMCLGKKSMFTAKEEKLLKLAEASDQDALRENAAAIRKRRQDALQEVCERLRAAGKL